jgi:predicted PurR-regulated permease PerM
MKQVAWFTTVVLLTLSAVVMLWRFSSEVTLFVFSLVVAAALRPLIAGLAKRGMRPTLAALLVFATGLGIAVALVLAVSNAFVSEIGQAGAAIAGSYVAIKEQGASGSGIIGAISRELPPLEDLYDVASSAQGAAGIASVLGATTGLLDAVAKMALILVLSVYLSIDYIRFERLWLSLLPVRLRERARTIWRALETGLGAYIRSEIVQSLLAAILLGLIYTVIGVQYPVALAISVALAWFIPMLGALLIFVMVIAVAMLSGPIIAGAAALGTLLVLLIMEFVVQPRLVGPRRFSSLLIIILLMAMVSVAGIVGLLVAPPLAAAIQIILEQLLPARGEQPAEVADNSLAGSTARLQERLVAARAVLASMPEPAAPEVSNMLDRLTRLVDKASS